MARSVRVFAIAAMLVVAVTASGTASAVTPNGPSGGAAADTYQNPVSLPDVENFGSPTLIRGHDGFWYAFGPGNPLNHGEERPLFPIMRSPDLTSWSYVGDVFTPDTFPTWAKEDSNMWAPSIEYVNGRYHLYFTLRNIAGYEQTPNTAIGVATAPTPTGPWTDSGRPLVTPKTWQPPDAPPRYRTIIDADALITPYGDRYLYYGGFGGGVYGIRLSGDGMSTVGEERRLTAAQIYEGPYVVHRDGWYYMFVSSGHCCKGPVTGYAVQVGRSRDPMGPFVDAEG
ncbi:MAG: family 43 glycosylhydrolase, partial [Micromonosporaceae bacterium]